MRFPHWTRAFGPWPFSAGSSPLSPRCLTRLLPLISPFRHRMSSTSTSTIEWVAGPQSTSFYTTIYTPPTTSPARAVVLFLHGFIEHVERYRPIFSIWADKGVAVVAYDQRGFGQTACNKEYNKTARGAYGKTCTSWQLEDAESMAKWTKAKFGETVPIFLMGHSMV